MYTLNRFAADLHLITVGDAFVYVLVGAYPATPDDSYGSITLQ